MSRLPRYYLACFLLFSLHDAASAQVSKAHAVAAGRSTEVSAKCTSSCKDVDKSASESMTPGWEAPAGNSCHPVKSGRYNIPDPKCTPGAINPTVTIEVIQTAKLPVPDGFRTCCVRNQITSEDAKNATYAWYGITKPAGNTGATQVCELDHLIPLEMGGADTLNNIWPQCGPTAASLNNRYFKLKDQVEDYLTGQVKAGTIDLRTAQEGISSDWTVYLTKAIAYCSTHKCLGD
jgi:hypothetical protein